MAKRKATKTRKSRKKAETAAPEVTPFAPPSGPFDSTRVGTYTVERNPASRDNPALQGR